MIHHPQNRKAAERLHQRYCANANGAATGLLLGACQGDTSSAEGHDLAKDRQLQLAEGAIRRASAMLAAKAESLAEEIERGEIEDRGGPDALRLLARLVRLANLQSEAPAGRC